MYDQAMTDLALTVLKHSGRVSMRALYAEAAAGVMLQNALLRDYRTPVEWVVSPASVWETVALRLESQMLLHEGEAMATLALGGTVAA
jgi:hypothetical protein